MLDAGPPPAPWLTANAWSNICFLDGKIPCLQGLKESIEKDAGWQEWQQSEVPEQDAYPGGMLLRRALELRSNALSMSW